MNPEHNRFMLPKRIGRGSFGEIYYTTAGPIAFKTVIAADNAEKLAKEYEMHKDVFSSLMLRKDVISLFLIPRPLALNVPAGCETHPPRFEYIPTPSGASTLGARRPISQHLFKPFAAATYAMDLIPPIPEHIAAHIRSLFFPAAQDRGPYLCRLYFGRTLRPFPSEHCDSGSNLNSSQSHNFINSNNFPIDITRYDALRRVLDDDEDLPDSEEVVHSMGQSLALIHDSAKLDGRDIELVLGGDGFGHLSFWLFDFNQMRPLDGLSDKIDALCSSFFHNDPYFPRPDPSNALYQKFKEGYMSHFVGSDHTVAQAFFDELETLWDARLKNPIPL